MYKIQFLLILTLSGPVALLAQQTTGRQAVPTPSLVKTATASQFQSGPTVGNPTPAYLTNEVQTSRQTVFTDHLLADQVESGKKYEYDVLIGGQKVSLPYPTQFQTQNRWQWRTDHPAFRFGAGSCTYVNEPNRLPNDHPKIS